MQIDCLESRSKKKQSTTKKILYKKVGRKGAVKVHLEPPHILLIKSDSDMKLDKDCVNIKLHRDPTSEKSGLYGFKMIFFDNG